MAENERQEIQLAVSALRNERKLIRRLFDVERPVDPVDRSNIAVELMRMLDRFVYFENELRQRQGKAPIPWEPDDAD